MNHSNVIKSKNILLDDRIIRRGDIIKSTHPEDDDEDLFVLNSTNAIFDVTFENDDEADLHEYLIDDVPFPTIKLHAGSVVQFNLNLADNSFNIFEGGEQILGYNTYGLAYTDSSDNVLLDASANGQVNGTILACSNK